VTSNQTILKIILNDKTQITLGENSALNISKYLYSEKNKKNNEVSLNFFKGSFKSITGRIGKLNPKKFKLKTKNASIGIRGTTVVGNQNKIACTSGLISVTSGGVTQMVSAGQMTKVTANKAPSKPTKYNAKEFGQVGTSKAATKKGSKPSGNQDGFRPMVNVVPMPQTIIDPDPQTDPDPDPQTDPDPDPQTDPDPDPQTDPDPDPQTDPDPMESTLIYNGFVSGIKNKNGFVITDRNIDSSDVKIEFNNDKTQVKANMRTKGGYSFNSDYTNTNSVTDDYSFSMNNDGDHVDTLGHNDYTTWGRWSGSKTTRRFDRLDNGYFIAGQLTNNDDLPNSGKVTYQGNVLGTVYDSGYKDLIGTSNITANFTKNSLSGNLKIYQGTVLFSNAKLKNVSISSGVNAFSGSLKHGNDSGSINGAFFGPQAAEIGGNWTLNKDGKKAAGIFNGVKQ